MKALKHMMENPFVTGAGISALAHSTWSLGTLFSGVMPVIAFDEFTTYFSWLYWFVPAFLIAFAMDIGQIDTSRKIRHDGLTWQRGLTFFVFAIATYYLQFLYIAHHMPALQIESGISDLHRFAVTELRNGAIWILPALLPLSTLLYTLADDKQDVKEPVQAIGQEESIEEHEIVVTDITPVLAEWIVDPEDLHISTCEDCGWECVPKDNAKSARMALQAHRGQHCEILKIKRLEMAE